MSRAFAAYLTWLVGAAGIGLLATSLVIPLDPRIAIQIDGDPNVSLPELLLGVLFWTAVTFVASAAPVKLSDGVHVAVSTAPIMAAAVLGGPTAAAWVALFGSTDLRELRGKVVWYGTFANHAALVLPAICGALVIAFLRVPGDNP